MRDKMRTSVVIALIAMQQSGCQDYSAKQVGGGLLGAGTGAIVGAQIGAGTGQLVSVALGTLLGAFAGSEIGRHIDRDDHHYADKAASQAFKTGKSREWINPTTNHKGKIYVGPQYYKNGVCYRNYTQKIYIDGKEEIARGSVCKQPDGSWVFCN